ncbi:MAG TPA: valine--tRNA ligase [Candidatus Manganitrophaceae bacterium]|nr:valine--tRNA ligase [Candidatus Manganitrophaceae bacterium]
MTEEILNKVYEPDKVEEKWAVFWEKERLFHAAPESTRPPYAMVIPPPNITGSLHLGHALNNTLQDILARWRRMSGDNVLWLPGTDHAGIATQNVVERQLAKEGIDRHTLGREAFIQRVWKWKETSGGTIVKQLKRLGASCDWERERFTMDEGLSRAVREVFVRLYEEGLIYRAERLINWCPRCRTALSDIEVEHEESRGKLYYIDYPLAEEPDQRITVATTRPETMLGDTAVAVHPEDERHRGRIGKKLRLPLADVEIPIIADPAVDRAFGTGAVKVTPAHDFNDEAMGKRHGLPFENIMTPDGKIAETPRTRTFSGKTISEARSAVTQALEQLGLLRKVEDHTHAVGKCYRCKTAVEPFLSTQWFVRVNDPKNSLAGSAIEAVRKKKIRLLPESWENNYYGWMENIQDWCVSRQIWWGHQIPAWYCVGRDVGQCGIDCKEPIVARARPEKCPRCGSADLRQDPDVLDTWFSSALWPFSTLGWPSELQPTPEKRKEAEAMLKTFYPTSALVTSFDILFFWVARMIMMGLHFMKEVPFRDVYIHALVRDAEGQKMSKSKGNVIDPLEIMSKYGTDALRFTLASMASPGRDIKLAEERIEGYRNFANKLWNAARFIMMSLPEESERATGGAGTLSIADRWIQSRLHRTIGSVNQSLGNYRFDEASALLYQFIWHEFCDWYLELIKVDLQDGSEAQKRGTAATLTTAFETLLRLLHPFMPFITEELWAHFPHPGENLAVAPYPQADAGKLDAASEGIVREIIIDAVAAIRNLRGEMNIPPSEELGLSISVDRDQGRELFERNLPYIKRLARVSHLEIGVGLAAPKMAATVLTGAAKIYIQLDETRLNKEIDRLEKGLAKLEKEMEPVEKKFSDPLFLSKAPKEVVAKLDLQRGEMREKKYKMNNDLQRFRGMIDSK